MINPMNRPTAMETLTISTTISRLGNSNTSALLAMTNA